MAKSKKIPEINASSQADIAFTVLIFFLVVSTMDVDTGIVRVLPPMPDPNVKQEDIKVKERNLFLVFVSGSGQLMAGGQVMDLHYLKDKAKEFILNPYNDENLPEKKEQTFDMPDGSKWTFPVSEGVISLQNTRVFAFFSCPFAAACTYAASASATLFCEARAWPRRK